MAIEPYSQEWEDQTYNALAPQLEQKLREQFPANRGAHFGAMEAILAKRMGALRTEIALEAAKQKATIQERMRQEGVARENTQSNFQRQQGEKIREENAALNEEARKRSYQELDWQKQKALYDEGVRRADAAEARKERFSRNLQTGEDLAWLGIPKPGSQNTAVASAPTSTPANTWLSKYKNPNESPSLRQETFGTPAISSDSNYFYSSPPGVGGKQNYFTPSPSTPSLRAESGYTYNQPSWAPPSESTGGNHSGWTGSLSDVPDYLMKNIPNNVPRGFKDFAAAWSFPKWG